MTKKTKSTKKTGYQNTVKNSKKIDTKEKDEQKGIKSEEIPDSTLEQEVMSEEVKKEVKDEKEVSEPKEITTEEKLKELQDKYLRLSAEFDNYRKRTLKEKIELIKSAGEEILKSILPVMDDFDRALVSMNDVKDTKALKEGIDLIYNKLKNFLTQNGVKEIDAINKKFNTDIHEAITKFPVPNKKMKGKVVDVIEKGYFLNDKVLRFPKVVVGE